MASEVMNLFWDLAALDDAARITAATKLIRHLAVVQTEQPGMNAELTYCVERLAKGLASARLAARQGFSMALIEVLANFSVVCVIDLCWYRIIMLRLPVQM